MTTEHDPRTRIVLSWLREEMHEDAERVLLRALDEVDTTPQRRSWWTAWRTNRMNTYAKLIATAAAVLVVAVVGYQFLPGSGGSGGQPAITPSPSPMLVARGAFGAKGAEVELDATGDGDSVAGTMTVSHATGDFTVDLKCTLTAEDGRILIGGDTTDSTSDYATKGARSAIVLKPGSPVHAAFEFELTVVDSPAASCMAFLEGLIDLENLTSGGPDALEPIEGTVELGTSGSGGTDATPSLLARGSYDDRDWGPVEFEATRDGAIVMGRMTIGRGEELGHLVIDLQCARTREDGRIAIGGYVTDGEGMRFADYRPAGQLAGLVLKRGGTPAGGAEIWVGSSPSYPGTETTDCLEYLDAWLTWDPDSMGFG